MDLEMGIENMPQDYLSPRSKVAQMLADIDNAPTPSPSPRAHGTSHNVQTLPERTESVPTTQKEQIASDDAFSDDDAFPTRPLGRAARRMMQQQKEQGEKHDDGDLYNVTPTRKRHAISRSLTRSPSIRSQHSAGLFVSPAKSSSTSGSDDDLPANPMQSSRLAELVAAKRKERLEKELAQKRLDKESGGPMNSSDLPEEIVENDNAADQPELDKILSDAARPTRKASKKAMLEMERETQRMAREQALAHQMKTKKKFSTSDLFARFNFRQPPKQQIDSSSPVPNSDSIGSAEKQLREQHSTPPSSPPTPWDTQKALVEHGALAMMVPVREDSIRTVTSLTADDDDELPPIEDLLSHSRSAKSQKTKPVHAESPSRNAAASRLRSRLINLPMQAEHNDSDDDIDIVQPMPAHLKAFDKARPAGSNGQGGSRAIHNLKHLAHLAQDSNSGRGKKLKAIVPPDIINAQLMASAKEHARKAQEERLAELQAKGIVVMSVEEQEKEAGQIEDLLEQARREADLLRKKERAHAKKEGNENLLAASDDEDEDWEGSDEGEELELDDDDDDDDDDGKEAANDMLDDVAVSDDGPEDGESEDDMPDVLPDQADADSEIQATPHIPQRKVRVIQDDDDDGDEQEDGAETEIARPTPITKARSQQDADPYAVFGFGNVAQTPAPTKSQQDDPFAAFGFGDAVRGPALLSPSQAFAATMQTPTQNFASTFASSAGRGPLEWPSSRAQPPTFGQLQSQATGDSQSQLVPASQGQERTQAIALDWDTQLPETPVAEARTTNSLIETPGWEPSQDGGLPSPWTAARRAVNAKGDEDDFETQSTVRVRISESPEVVVPRAKGRLTRGVRVARNLENDTLARPGKNAFAEMQRLRMESMNAAERAAAEKEMKDMMDDQAEESEDEYAGLGGDDSNMIAPETEEDRAMIDHSNIEIDEDQAREMAKFYAERQRVAEEAATSKLFKDITTGALRRRQGVGWELDEDEDEIAARRRQIKQREEARKRQLLLQDDNVKGLVEGKGDSKGREAFLRTIGDDDDDDDFHVEEEMAEEQNNDATLLQDSQATSIVDPLREVSHNKRKLDDDRANSQPAKSRRTKEVSGLSRPTSALQVRESLSFLLDEPVHALYGPSILDELDLGGHESDREVEEELARDNDGGYAPDRVQEMPPPPLPTQRLPATQRRTPAKPAVIDRLSLRRGSSSSSSTSSASAGWSAWSLSSGSSSKAPSLLRRATTNLSTSSTNERGVSYGSDRRGSAPSIVKTGGSKKSSLAYQARAQEKKAIAERAEQRKENERQRIAELRRQQGGALTSGFNGGQWE